MSATETSITWTSTRPYTICQQCFWLKYDDLSCLIKNIDTDITKSGYSTTKSLLE